MHYEKQTVGGGETITSSWGNHVQEQFDEAVDRAGFEGLVQFGMLPGVMDDLGRKWNDLDQQYSQSYIRDLCYLGNGITLAGTDNGGKILRSTDYGATWTDLGQQFLQGIVRTFAYLGNGIVLAGTGNSGKILRFNR